MKRLILLAILLFPFLVLGYWIYRGLNEPAPAPGTAQPPGLTNQPAPAAPAK